MATLRLKIPQWQGGVNPNYVFGAELLAAIVPPNKNDETVEIQIDKNFDNPIRQMDGIDYGQELQKQMQETWQVLDRKSPDKVIVLGGDCAVSQVPFDYLSGRYGEKLGILWLDAHPDCADTSNSTHLHEMVMGNLAGLNSESKLTKVKNPGRPERVFLAGLIEEELRKKDMACKKENIRIASPEELSDSSETVMKWIEETGIEYLAVHWDLDVLSEQDFRSIYPAEPHTDVKDFPAAVGRMKLKEVGRILNDVEKKVEIVGLSIAEHLPWDAFNLRSVMRSLDIFHD